VIRTLIVNLERSHDRRASITHRMTALGMPFERVVAADGQALTGSQLARYSPRAAFARIGRDMHPNEIGCCLSHIGIWQDMVARGDDQVLVIEDDMLLDDDLPDIVRSLEWVPSDANIVNLSWDMANPVGLAPISSQRFMCRFDREVMRTGSYILRRRGAMRLLENAFPIRMPVDSYMGDETNAGPIYGITPRPVRWNDAMPSVTWTDSTRESFAAASRSSLKGLFLRVVNRILGRHERP
jgi:glycosyl transferase family 25